MNPARKAKEIAKLARKQLQAERREELERLELEDELNAETEDDRWERLADFHRDITLY